MKLSSTSAAKLLLTLSIITAAVSVWKGLEWQRSAQNLTRQLHAIQANELQQNQQVAELVELLPGNEAPLPLAPTLVHLIATLNEAQLDNRVSIAPLASADAANGASVDLLELAQPFANTDLRTLTIKVRGTYREYAGLRRYIELIQKHPVALTRLAIAGNTFEIDIQLFGAV